MFRNLHTTPLQPQYADAIEDLLAQSYWNNNHFDWTTRQEWIQNGVYGPSFVAWRNELLAGVMALSAPWNGSCWIRQTGIHDYVTPEPVFELLWMAVLDALIAENITQVSILATNLMLFDILEDNGFTLDEQIITLQRQGDQLPPSRPYSVTVSPLTEADLPALVAVDNSAFLSPWQMTFDDLQSARNIALVATGAYLDGELVGYQMTTHYQTIGHLARLAVIPSQQGHGVAHALLEDLLRRLFAHGIYHLSVNTQFSNKRSQALYERFGFRRNGYDLPVWTFKRTP